MDFNYITLNSLDEETKARMAKDVSERGFKGSKSAYVAGLIADGLDRREELRQLSSKEEVDSLKISLSNIKDSVAELVRKGCEGEIGAEVNRLLLIECYRMLELIVDYLDLDATEIREGRMDSLPMNIGFKESAMRRAYDGDRA